MSYDLLGMAGRLMVVGAELGIAQHEVLEKACTIFETSAKEAIGTYEFGWAPLGPAAIAKHGDTPLLDSGALRDSIEHQVHGSEGWVGTNNEYAIFQELGTSRGIPPRPFMGGALNAKGPEVEKELGHVVAKVFAKG